MLIFNVATSNDRFLVFVTRSRRVEHTLETHPCQQATRSSTSRQQQQQRRRKLHSCLLCVCASYFVCWVFTFQRVHINKINRRNSTMILKICIFTVLLGSGCLAQRPGFRVGAGHPASQRHLPKRVTDAPPSKEDYKPTEQCPDENGFFPDGEQCDKYYACVDGVGTERLCPDGMVFNDYSPNDEKCDLPYNIDCSKRPELQTPQPSQHCPRKNGYFGHEADGSCDKFYYCVDGQFNMITCPVGLVFNPKTGICTWPDEVGVLGCKSEDIFEFQCPKVNETEAATHPRYADPDDCQYFYVCVNGEIPRRNGCKLGQVFDDEKKLCEWSRLVPECADWYKGRLTAAELDELENPKPKTEKPPRTRGPSRRRGQQQPKQRKADDDDEAAEQ